MLYCSNLLLRISEVCYIYIFFSLIHQFLKRSSYSLRINKCLMLHYCQLSALQLLNQERGKGKSPWSSRRDRRYLVSSSWSVVLVCSVTKYKHKSYHIAAPPRPIMFLLFSSLVLKCQQQKDILFRAVYTIFFFLSLRVLGVHCCGK